MSWIRLAGTTAGMAAAAAVLAVLTPPADVLTSAVTAPQRLADTTGPDAVVLAAAAGLAWLAWAWGALGLLLTAAGALPGELGATARLVARLALPAGARRAAAVALGMGLGIGGPFAGLAAAAPAPVVSAVPDWPAAPGITPAAVPARPAPTGGGDHVVVRGECLWEIAAGSLRASGGRPADGEIAGAVRDWWTANAAVVGPDPDLLLPGQVLHPPQETR